mmetsp:Transcript_103772/g.184068  ORF Transcript_103772/g.184068 Transcript_103772/m.184068 type:complete len:226 (+) Transcript_103772:1771-2448(+)
MESATTKCAQNQAIMAMFDRYLQKQHDFLEHEEPLIVWQLVFFDRVSLGSNSYKGKCFWRIEQGIPFILSMTKNHLLGIQRPKISMWIKLSRLNAGVVVQLIIERSVQLHEIIGAPEYSFFLCVGTIAPATAWPESIGHVEDQRIKPCVHQVQANVNGIVILNMNSRKPVNVRATWLLDSGIQLNDRCLGGRGQTSLTIILVRKAVVLHFFSQSWDVHCPPIFDI